MVIHTEPITRDVRSGEDLNQKKNDKTTRKTILEYVREELDCRFESDSKLYKDHIRDLQQRIEPAFVAAGLNHVEDFQDRAVRKRLTRAIQKGCPGSFANTRHCLDKLLDLIGKCLKIAARAESVGPNARHVRSSLLEGKGSTYSNWKRKVQRASGFTIDEVEPMSEEDIMHILVFLEDMKKSPSVYYGRPDDAMKRLVATGTLGKGDWHGLRKHLRKHPNKWPATQKVVDRLVLWCYLRLTYGRRFNEIVDLLRGDIDLANQKFYPKTSKKKGYPTKTPLPISATLLPLLKDYLSKHLEKDADARLFPKRHETMYKAQRAVLFLSGVANWDPKQNPAYNMWHRIRSTFTQILQRNGIDPMIAADVFGIMRRTMEDHYVSPNVKANNRAVVVKTIDDVLMQGTKENIARIREQQQVIEELEERARVLRSLMNLEEKMMDDRFQLSVGAATTIKAQIAPGTYHECTYLNDGENITASTPFSALVKVGGRPDSSSNLGGPISTPPRPSASASRNWSSRCWLQLTAVCAEGSQPSHHRREESQVPPEDSR
jgi:hypothetical protein